MAYKLFNTAANFRALRGLCGITQQHVADALDARDAPAEDTPTVIPEI